MLVYNDSGVWSLSFSWNGNLWQPVYMYSKSDKNLQKGFCNIGTGSSPYTLNNVKWNCPFI